MTTKFGPKSYSLLKASSIVLLTIMSVSFGWAQTADEKERKAAREKELNAVVTRDIENHERLRAMIDKGSISPDSTPACDEIIRFRERWWGPQGVAASETKLELYAAGSLSEAYETRARAKLLLKDHNGALADFALSLSKATDGEQQKDFRISETDAGRYEYLFKHIETHQTVAERLADIDVVIQKAPSVGVLYMQRAQYQQDRGRVAADLETALRLAPKVSRVYEAALDFYFGEGERDKALAVLEKANREMPLLFRYHRLRADVLRGDLETGDLKLALQRLTAAIDECACQRSRLYFYLRERASVNCRPRNYGAGISDASRAIDITEAMSGGKPTTPRDDPDDWTQTSQPYFYRASAYIAKAMYKEALPDLNVLVEMNGWGSDYLIRAQVRCKLGDFSGAKSDELKAAADLTIDKPCKAL